MPFLFLLLRFVWPHLFNILESQTIRFFLYLVGRSQERGPKCQKF